MTVFSPEKEKPEDLLACAKPLNDPFASWNSLLGYIPEDSEDEDVDLGEEFSAKPMATSAAKRINIGLKDSVATNQVSSLNLPKKYFFQILYWPPDLQGDYNKFFSQSKNCF